MKLEHLICDGEFDDIVKPDIWELIDQLRSPTGLNRNPNTEMMDAQHFKIVPFHRRIPGGPETQGKDAYVEYYRIEIDGAFQTQTEAKKVIERLKRLQNEQKEFNF